MKTISKDDGILMVTKITFKPTKSDKGQKVLITFSYAKTGQINHITASSPRIHNKLYIYEGVNEKDDSCIVMVETGMKISMLLPKENKGTEYMVTRQALYNY